MKMCVFFLWLIMPVVGYRFLAGQDLIKLIFTCRLNPKHPTRQGIQSLNRLTANKPQGLWPPQCQ